jgi:CRISPR type I-E-associated protein CasB/Cse2
VNRSEFEAFARALRKRYDALGPGPTAQIKRCSTAAELCAEGVYWRLIDEAGVPEGERRRMAHVVACFAAAGSGRESFARWVRSTVYGDVKPQELPARALRMRRLLAARDRDELVHQLSRLLRHGFAQSRRGVDWGPLGADVLFWGDGVRQRWAQDFYTSEVTTAAARQEETTHA